MAGVISTESTRAERRGRGSVVLIDGLGALTHRTHPLLMLLDLDSHASRNWHFPSNAPEALHHHHKVVGSALKEDVLILAPSCQEKIFIAAIVVHNFQRWFPHGQIVYLSPFSSELSFEFQTIVDQAEIDPSIAQDLTKVGSSTSRLPLWKARKLFLSTPKFFLNDLVAGALKAESLVFLIINQASDLVEQYSEIVEKLRCSSSFLRVVAFSKNCGNNDNHSLQPSVSRLGYRLRLSKVMSLNVPASHWALPPSRAPDSSCATFLSEVLPCLERPFKFWAFSSKGGIDSGAAQNYSRKHELRLEVARHSRTYEHYLGLMRTLDRLQAMDQSEDPGDVTDPCEPALLRLINGLCRIIPGDDCVGTVDRIKVFDQVFGPSVPRLLVEPSDISDNFFLDPPSFTQERMSNGEASPLGTDSKLILSLEEQDDIFTELNSWSE